MTATIHVPTIFRTPRPRPHTTGDVIDLRETFEREQIANARNATPEQRGSLLQALAKEMDTLKYMAEAIRFGIDTKEYDTATQAILDLRDITLVPANPPRVRAIIQPKREAMANTLAAELLAAINSPAKA